MIFPTLCRGGAVPVCSADNASNFDGYGIARYSAWGGSTSVSCHGNVTPRRDAASRDLDSIWEDNDCSQITIEGSAFWGRREGVLR